MRVSERQQASQIAMESDLNGSLPGFWRGSSVKMYGIRFLALLCACSFSFGSHFGREFLGPLKSSLIHDIGMTNLQFSAMLASYSVNNTWTPLVAGFLASALGTARSSLFVTLLILLGQIILLWGRRIASVGLMTAGLFVFGLGVSPLSVVQETIIVRFFSNHGLGVSLAFGLLAGKGSSFIAAFTSFPLSQKSGPFAPFALSTLLAAFSFSVSLLYLLGSRWLATGSGIALEEAEKKADGTISTKERVMLNDVTRLGDVFWTYIAFNFLSGCIWSPYYNIAANLFQVRYGYTEYEAGKTASFLFAGSIILYPIVGFITDRFHRRSTIYRLCLLASTLTLLGYFWLLLPPHLTHTALPAVCFFTLGQGFASLLLVLIVPKIVPQRYVPTALGAHKSIEQTGATVSITFAGYLLDIRNTSKPSSPRSDSSVVSNAPGGLPTPEAVFRLLCWFALFNVLQFISIYFLWAIDSTRQSTEPVIPSGSETPSYRPLSSEEPSEDHVSVKAADPEEEDELSDEDDQNGRVSPNSYAMRRPSMHSDERLFGIPDRRRLRGVGNIVDVTSTEYFRGKVFYAVSGATIIGAWIFYVVSLVLDFQRKSSGGT